MQVHILDDNTHDLIGACNTYGSIVERLQRRRHLRAITIQNSTAFLGGTASVVTITEQM